MMSRKIDEIDVLHAVVNIASSALRSADLQNGGSISIREAVLDATQALNEAGFISQITMPNLVRSCAVIEEEDLRMLVRSTNWPAD